MFLTEFDGGKAVIEPEAIIGRIKDMPEVCIGVFSKSIVEEWVGKYNGEVIGVLKSIVDDTVVYRLRVDGFSFAFFMSGVGGPKAAGQLEELIAMGARHFVYFGCCGVLRNDIADGHLIVPTAAIRDEGLSFHYLAPADEIVLDAALVRLAEEAMAGLGLPYVGGKVWTTDAFYRETPAKLQKAREMGAVCVEMECASLAAAARFRGVSFIQFFWSADNLDAPEWERRGLGLNGDSMAVKCMAAALEIGQKLAEIG